MAWSHNEPQSLRASRRRRCKPSIRHLAFQSDPVNRLAGLYFYGSNDIRSQLIPALFKKFDDLGTAFLIFGAAASFFRLGNV